MYELFKERAMKTFLKAAILGVTGLAGVAGAEAQDVHKYRGGNEPRHERHEHRDYYRDHRRGPVRVERIWIAPRFETRITSYDRCGKPIYGQVCIAAGYWSTSPCN
jgi:hypothetical protein